MRALLPVLAIGAAATVVTGVILLRADTADTPSAYAGIIPAAQLPAELKGIVQRLGSHDPVERAQATLELRAMGSRAEPAVPYLARLLQDRSRIRIERDAKGKDLGPLNRGGTGYFTCPGALAASAMAHASESGIDALLKGMSHKSDDIRRSALDGAGHAMSPRVVPPTIWALADENGLIREAAEAALLRRGSAAIEPLSAAMRGGERRTREAAASLLARLNDPQATRALLAAVDDPRPEVRGTAESALGRMDDRACVASLIACLGEHSLRPHAINRLVQVETAQKTALLVEALRNKDYRIRSGAAEALAAINDATAADALQQAEQDEQPEVQQAAREALAALRARPSP